MSRTRLERIHAALLSLPWAVALLGILPVALSALAGVDPGAAITGVFIAYTAAMILTDRIILRRELARRSQIDTRYADGP